MDRSINLQTMSKFAVSVNFRLFIGSRELMFKLSLCLIEAF